MERNMPQRKRLRVYDRKCIGCMACSSVCPEGVITLNDLGARRTLRFGYTCERRECTRCAQACPEGVLSLIEAAEDAKEGSLAIFFEMACCERCGNPFTPRRLLESTLSRLPAFLKSDNDAEPAWLRLCPECRRYEEAEGAMKGALNVSAK